MLPTGIPGTSYGLGILETGGWIGHNGSIPGYQSVTVHLPSERATLVILTNTDVSHQGQEPSTLLARAITGIVTPANVYDGAVPPQWTAQAAEAFTVLAYAASAIRGRGHRGGATRRREGCRRCGRGVRR